MDEEGVEEEGAAEVNPDIPRLHQVLRTEVLAPEVLKYEEDLVERVRTGLMAQQQTTEAAKERANHDDKRTIAFYEMEIDRVRYALARYFRVRLLKLQRVVRQRQRLTEEEEGEEDVGGGEEEEEEEGNETGATQRRRMLARSVLNDAELVARLSPHELSAALRIEKLGAKYLRDVVLNGLDPEHVSTMVQQDLDDHGRRQQAIEGAGGDQFVFCCTAEAGDEVDLDGEEPITLTHTDVHVVRYRMVREHVLEGRVILL